MTRRSRVVLAAAARVASLAWPGLATAAAPQDFERDIRPLLTRFCLECHSTKELEGDLDLERFSSLDDVDRHPLVWQRVETQLFDREMPPSDAPQLDDAQRAQLLHFVRTRLEVLALRNAGDPGPVVLRRLSNAEYTYTLRDLTGVASLDPVREFPVDGAAGEGFTNVGNALVMSPALLAKYLDAGKRIAEHAVLVPDGIRFSPGITRRDFTEELLGEIRNLYREFTDASGAEVVDLQGIVFSTNEGGRLPLAKYLHATLELRDAPGNLAAIETTARQRGLSPKYLGTLLAALHSDTSSLLLDPVREHWRRCTSSDVPSLAMRIAEWQKALWKFSSVGHIGKAGGPKAWLEPVDPLADSHELRVQLPTTAGQDVLELYLAAGDAGDGSESDVVQWRRPRFVKKGRPELLLRDLRNVARVRLARRERLFAMAAAALAAAEEAIGAPARALDLTELARSELALRHAIDTASLSAWFACLGIGSGGEVVIDTHFTTPLARPSTYEVVAGWGSPETPLLVANASDQHVRIPGNLKPHGIAVHPSPTQKAAVGWRSPITGSVRVTASIQHAHPDCGNGVTWSLELRRGATRRQLAHGAARGGAVETPSPIEALAVQRGDLVSLLIGSGSGDHSCDLTAVDLALTDAEDEARAWDLAADCSSDVLAANPHADRHGNADVWHFYVEPDPVEPSDTTVLPSDSVLARWQWAADTAERQRLARELLTLIDQGRPATDDSPDGRLYRALRSLRGPLVEFGAQAPEVEANGPYPSDVHPPKDYALDPADFGKRLDGAAIDGADLAVRAPSVLAIEVPAELVAGCEFVTTGTLEPSSGAGGSVQLQASLQPPMPEPGPVATQARVTAADGPWTSNNQRLTHAVPIIAPEGSAARTRIAASFDEFRALFPAALCYAKIVPVDEVVTLTQFHREDGHLVRLMLDDTQAATLDRLWGELRFVSQDALTQVDAFEQIWQYATQDADPSVFEPLREPIAKRAAAFREQLLASEPEHLEAVLQFAARAYRRPLTADDQDELAALYRRLRDEGLPHDAAIRLMIARILLAPAFLYRAEQPARGSAPSVLSDWELASRLSYFLWSSAPDEALLASAASGALHEPAELAAQAQRMLRDPRVRRLAIEFGCAWLHVHGFDELDEKSERHFPTFPALRGAMYEETIRFLTDLFQDNGSVLDLLDADHTFLNGALAEHYGIPGVTGDAWRRVDGVKQFSRGGILAQATVLAKQSGASRTSPILRGNWLSEVLLGEKLPRPPKDVPRLPDDEAEQDLTMREITERHSKDPRCARCHDRIDAFGFSLEAFDAIGRRRDRDLAGRPIDTRVTAMDGTAFDGIDGLRGYLLTTRRDAFVKQFCKKLLGYSLGRAVRLSDEPLLAEMRTQLAANEHRFDVLVGLIVQSRQFREIRGRDAAHDD